jgi:hypothetical protein
LPSSSKDDEQSREDIGSEWDNEVEKKDGCIVILNGTRITGHTPHIVLCLVFFFFFFFFFCLAFEQFAI